MFNVITHFFAGKSNIQITLLQAKSEKLKIIVLNCTSGWKSPQKILTSKILTKKKVYLNSNNVKYSAKRHSQTKRVLENLKHFPASWLQQVNLKVVLNPTEKNVSYHFTHILFMKGSHLLIASFFSVSSYASILSYELIHGKWLQLDSKPEPLSS